MKLQINRCSIISEGRFIPGKLPQSGEASGLDLSFYLLQCHSPSRKSNYLSLQIGEIVTKKSQILAITHFEMPRHKYLAGCCQERIQRGDPVRNAAFVHGRARMAHEEVAGRDRLLLREVDVCVTQGVRGSARE